MGMRIKKGKREAITNWIPTPYGAITIKRYALMEHPKEKDRYILLIWRMLFKAGKVDAKTGNKMRKKNILITIVLLSVGSISFGQHQDYAKWTLDEVQKGIDHCEIKVERTIVNLEGYDKSPRTVPAGDKHWEAKPAGGWTNGFWAGILWYVYEGTGNERIRTEAEKFTEEIETVL